MQHNDVRPKRAVLVSLAVSANGYVISLDDAEETGLTDQWKLVEHITSKELPKEVIESLSLPEEELAGLGYYVLARLHAFRTLGEI